MGNEKRSRESDLASLPFFKRAVELDPNFAMAYARLGAVYANLDEDNLAEENARKAFDLRDRTSEAEKFYITDHYYLNVTGDLPKAIENYELWIQTYPRDWSPRNNLAANYTSLGDFQKALPQALAAVRLQPDDRLPYINLMYTYLGLNQLEEAKAIYKQAVDKNLDDPTLNQMRFQIAYLEGDAQEMQRQSAAATGKPEEYNILASRAGIAASHGRLKEARDFFQQAFDSAKKFDLQGAAGNVAGFRGITEYWFGDLSAAKSWSAQSLVIHHEEEAWPAAVLALTGDTAKAEKLITEQSARRPNDTVLQQLAIPPVRAAIAIKRGNPAAAIEALKTSTEIEAGDISRTFYRGLAYLSMKSGKEAAAEFRKVIERKTISALSPLHSISQLELGRSLALAGDKPGARSAYQDLFAIWKDADPDLPLLKQAKAEYARLQ